MQVRIGIAETAREIELDIEDVEEFKDRVEEAIADDDVPILWVTDVAEHLVGIPVDRIGYIDVTPEHKMAPGFR
jgi:hypothetical protein